MVCRNCILSSLYSFVRQFWACNDIHHIKVHVWVLLRGAGYFFLLLRQCSAVLSKVAPLGAGRFGSYNRGQVHLWSQQEAVYQYGCHCLKGVVKSLPAISQGLPSSLQPQGKTSLNMNEIGLSHLSHTYCLGEKVLCFRHFQPLAQTQPIWCTYTQWPIYIMQKISFLFKSC